MFCYFTNRSNSSSDHHSHDRSNCGAKGPGNHRPNSTSIYGADYSTQYGSCGADSQTRDLIPNIIGTIRLY